MGTAGSNVRDVSARKERGTHLCPCCADVWCRFFSIRAMDRYQRRTHELFRRGALARTNGRFTSPAPTSTPTPPANPCPPTASIPAMPTQAAPATPETRQIILNPRAVTGKKRRLEHHWDSSDSSDTGESSPRREVHYCPRTSTSAVTTLFSPPPQPQKPHKIFGSSTNIVGPMAHPQPWDDPVHAQRHR